MIKKIISMALLMCMLSTYIYMPPSYALIVGNDVYENIIGNGTKDNQINYDLIKDELPEEVTEFFKLGTSTYYLNTEFWIDKKIVVYGKPSMITGNEFKNATRIDGQDVMNKGYYKEPNGKYGEYRYHGYTLTADKQSLTTYANTDYPWDVKKAPPKDELIYMYKFWEEKADNISTWSYRALEDNKGRETITQTLDYRILSSTARDIYPDKVTGFYNTWEHLNVQSPSGTDYNGEGKIYHTYNNKDYYRAMSLDVVTVKEHITTSTDIEIFEKGNNQFEDGKAIVRVNINAILHDKDIYADSLEYFYQYYRKDVLKANFSITGKNYTNAFSLTKDKANYVDGNYAIGDVIEIEVTEDMLIEGVLKLKLESSFSYRSKEEEVLSTTTSDEDVDSLGEGLICLFNISDIKIKPTDTFDDSMVKYKDTSFGKINTYELEIKRIEKGEDYINVFTGSDKELITNSIYSYLDPIVTSEMESDKFWKEKFYAKQTVTDVYGQVKTLEIEFQVGALSLEIIDMTVDMPIDAFDIVSYKPSYEIIEGEPSSLTVEVNGIEVDFDVFFSGNFKFYDVLGDVGRNNKIVKCKVSFMSADDVESYWEEWVKVYNTKPTTQLTLSGKTKENRKIEVRNDSESVNNEYLWSHYPITSYEWSYIALDGDNNSLQYKDLGDLGKDLQYKTEGFYQVSLVGTNSLGRKSDPYNLQIYVMPDRPANVIFTIWNNVLTRNEDLMTTLDVASLDGDNVVNEKIELYRDIDKDGTFETFITTMMKDEFLLYSPSELDNYRAIYTCDETFGEPTIAEFLDGTEKRSRTVIRDFFVDNLRPINEIEIDLPIEFVNVDTYIMGDQNLSRTTNIELKNNRINYNNALRLYGLNADVKYRDLFTYTYSSVVNDSKNTGSSSPPSTLSYSSSGYNGTLTLTNSVDNGRSVNDRYRDSYTSCHTETVRGAKHFDSYCCRDCLADLPSSERPTSNCCKSCWYYDTTTKEVCSTSSRWVDDWNWYANWTGYYQGTVYKYVKQPYTNPFREISEKYLIYIADSNGINLTDYNEMVNKADYKLILIGTESQKASFPKIDLFIKNDGSDINLLVAQAIALIGSENETSNAYLVKVGESFNLTSAQMDSEGDVINVLGYQYVQNQKYDNPTGTEANTRMTFLDDTTAYNNYIASKFDNVGEYSIYRKVKDSTGNASFDKESNLATIVVDVKRPPVCDFDLDWTYNVTKLKYDTVWTDSAFDPDHEYSREDKGIVDRNIMYRKSGEDWIYKIPSDLTFGTYEVRYSVKDVDGWWSDIKTKHFTLNNIPPVQFEGKLKSESDKFTLSSIPASENILLYDLWSRYPYDENLEYFMKKDGIDVTAIQYVVPVNTNSKVLINGDIQWNDISIILPDTLKDGIYNLYTGVYDKNNINNKTVKTFTLNIFTPINLVGIIGELNGGSENIIKASTSEYVKDVKVKIFKGTEYETELNMNSNFVEGEDDQMWSVNYLPETFIPEGKYSIEFCATLPNNKSESKVYDITLNQLNIVFVDVVGSWNHYRGQTDLFDTELTTEAHRFLSLEEIEITAEVLGNPDEVYVKMDNELESMSYVDNSGNEYTYFEFTGATVVFPLQMSSDDLKHWKVNYILPLADSTKDSENNRLKTPYKIIITAVKNDTIKNYEINDIEITGNIYNHIYIQQKNN